jgi:hypothetical protein
MGEPVFVLAGDENGLNRKWRKGTVSYESGQILTDSVCRNTQVTIYIQYAHSIYSFYITQGIFRSYHVKYTVKRKGVVSLFTPGLQMEMKPDTPEVRELLREAGVIL